MVQDIVFPIELADPPNLLQLPQKFKVVEL
jgi:hypothetical protein